MSRAVKYVYSIILNPEEIKARTEKWFWDWEKLLEDSRKANE